MVEMPSVEFLTAFAAVRIARLLTVLNDSEAAPCIARFAQRRDVDAYDRARSEVYVVTSRKVWKEF